MSSISITKENKCLVFSYQPEMGIEWINERLGNNEPVIIKRSLYVTKENVYQPPKNSFFLFNEDSLLIKAGTLNEQNYYQLNDEIFNLRKKVFIHHDCDVAEKHFILLGRFSLFKKLSAIAQTDIYIGGSNRDAIPFMEYRKLTNRIPNRTEITHYIDARVSATFKEYIESRIDVEERYSRFLDKKINTTAVNNFPSLYQYEINKYELIRNTLKEMLEHSITYSEHQWQDKILEIIILLYPKYISAFKEVSVKNIYTNKKKRIDIMLVDTSGFVDIIEIKKPFDDCLLRQTTYRDNYIPAHGLVGTIMQVEKYIYLLSKSGQTIEQDLTKKYQNALPENLDIKVANPQGIIIMGRENTMTSEQKSDFAIIKRKYKSIVDIISYDELLSRLDITISQLTSKNENHR
ncbi:Shedu immune nuclease family protein [Aeromonas allosaccharophila]|uniref:Shedu immune nuclease family protein n=1 Tax=Aeromonas allosaccharophila TaxID=656 RepID=UPI0036DEDC2D